MVRERTRRVSTQAAGYGPFAFESSVGPFDTVFAEIPVAEGENRRKSPTPLPPQRRFFPFLCLALALALACAFFRSLSAFLAAFSCLSALACSATSLAWVCA